MMTVMILAGLWVLIVVISGILIVRGVKDLRALKEERRAVAARPTQARAGTRNGPERSKEN